MQLNTLQLNASRQEPVLNRFSNAEIEDMIFQAVKNFLSRNFNVSIRRGDRINNPTEIIDMNGRAGTNSEEFLPDNGMSNVKTSVVAKRARINFTKLNDMSALAKLLVGDEGEMANGKKFLHLAASCSDDPRAGVIQIGDVVIETSVDQNTFGQKITRRVVDQEYIDNLQTINLKYAFS